MSVPDNFEEERSWASKIGRKVFPIIVAYAEEHRSLRYKDLDAELHRIYKTPNIQRLTVYGYPLGVIGHALEKEYGNAVPPINALVINKTGIPGHGCDYFVRRYLPNVKYGALSLDDKKAVIKLVHQKIFEYPRWRKILAQFDLANPPNLSTKKPVGLQKKFGKNFSGEGESEAHRALKEFVRLHPEVIALPKTVGVGYSEYCMYSGDKADVLFRHQAVLRAEQLEKGDVPNAKAVLVCELDLPVVLKQKATLFGIRVFDKVEQA